MFSITLEELHLYHSIDREIFQRLIVNLSRDIGESILVMAIWLWLEKKSFPSIIAILEKQPDPMLVTAANEAVSCLRALESSRAIRVPPNGGLPFTSRIMRKEISLQFFVQNKFTAISGMKTLLNTACARIFTDIFKNAVPEIDSYYPNDQGLNIPGFPHPTYGSISIVSHPLEYDLLASELWAWDSSREVPQDDRTMFLTFSKGYPVTREEVTDLFNSLFGNCVECVQMAGVRSNDDQPLYALMVLRSVSALDQMLDGKRNAKFKTNGKHIWARKYEPRG